MKIQDRFIEYCKINTTSDASSKTTPSSACQWDLAHLLVKQMKELGMNDAHVDEHCVVYGTIEGNCDEITDVIGLIAHMDTSPDFSGENVKPRIIENYDGKNIQLNPELVMNVVEMPSILKYVGHDVIVTDGTTLLGADDKAGIAIIMEVARQFQDDPSIQHGTIKVAFTPDEEIGEGADHFDVAKFGADYAFTCDGGSASEYCMETFNAASAYVEIEGVSIHPGGAKDIMINASNVAMEFHACLPVHARPEHTSGFEGFNHLLSMNSSVPKASLEYIIRNHDAKLHQQQCDLFISIAKYLNEKYQREIVKIEIVPSYRNMKEELIHHPQIMEKLSAAITAVGLNPKSISARGGTDGSRLTFMGLPCPNIGTGGVNAHGPFEAVSIQEMEKMVEVVKAIVCR